MAVHVERATSEVSVEGGPGAETAPPQSATQEVSTMKEFLAHMIQDRRRTAAEGFDD